MATSYLGTTGEWVTRSQLAYLFRANSPEAVARHYVRNLLNRAHDIPHVSGLDIEADRCRWSVATDVQQFRSALRAKDWYGAIEAFQGPFLQGFNTTKAPIFDAWVQSTRDRLHREWRKATLEYAADQESSGCYEVAAQAVDAYLMQEPLDEEAIAVFLRNTYLSGKRDLALDAARRFTRELELDMGIVPLPETLELINRIRDGQNVKPVVRPWTRGRRWTDRATENQGELERLVALLKDPDIRLQTIVESKRTGREAIVLTRKISEGALVDFALLELAETLIADGHPERACELLVLILTRQKEHNFALRDRIDQTWDSLAAFMPSSFIQDAKAKW